MVRNLWVYRFFFVKSNVKFPISLPFLALQLSTIWLVTASAEFVIKLGDFNDSDIRCSPGVGSSGVLQITPNADTSPFVSAGRCLYYGEVKLLDATGTRVSSFSTTFTFSMYEAQNEPAGSSALVGFAFILVDEPRPEVGYNASVPQGCCREQLQYLGILNETSDGKNSSHTFAVEFDLYDSSMAQMFNDPPYDHVGINVNSMNSSFRARAGRYMENLSCETSHGGNLSYTFAPMNLSTGELIQAWIDYDGESKQLNVSTSSQLGVKPTKPLLKETIDLADVVQETMYVGFSSAGDADEEKTPSLIYDWSFNVGGKAPPLYPESVNPGCGSVSHSTRASLAAVYVSVIASLAVLGCMFFILGAFLTKQKRALRKEFQLLELENLEYGPIKYTYRALRVATRGFDPSQNLCGTFYKAVLGASGRVVAVKRISRSSKGSEREFIAEMKVIGRLRHRNLVAMQGWCYHRQDLLLVYEFLPYGNLDGFLFNDHAKVLSWNQRVHILKGVATALVYLHEECQLEKPMVHGNVKASNVMLDGERNARLGDFGLARFYERNNKQSAENTAAETVGKYSTCVKFTEETDVQSFGALVLQVATGRRPVELATLPPEDKSLVNWTLGLHRKKKLLDAVDGRLGADFPGDEFVTVVRVGLLCSHPDPSQRPSMRRVKQMLSGELAIPPLPSFRHGGVTAPTGMDWDDSPREYSAPEISLIDSPEIGLIANFNNSMGDRGSSRDSMGKRSRSYGS